MASSEVELTDEQKRFLAECEEEFGNRYTEKDSEFMRVHETEPKSPPCVHPWYGGRDGGRRRDNRQDQYDRGGREDRPEWRGRDRDRNWGDDGRGRHGRDSREYYRDRRDRY